MTSDEEAELCASALAGTVLEEQTIILVLRVGLK